MEVLLMTHDEAMVEINTCLAELNTAKAEIEKLVAEKKGHLDDIQGALASLAAIDRTVAARNPDWAKIKDHNIPAGVSMLRSEIQRYDEDVKKTNDQIREKWNGVRITVLGDWSTDLSAEEAERFMDDSWALYFEVRKAADDGLRLSVGGDNTECVFRDEEVESEYTLGGHEHDMPWRTRLSRAHRQQKQEKQQKEETPRGPQTEQKEEPPAGLRRSKRKRKRSPDGP
ncbi:unnamed protein product [Clonostachys rosea f. rosea IK726]|jgi:hypothetical protein|uniref:Uncharacterized protein n=1 Tax=Clonostachys rosea f. rosea IK726 TaxID=1349383 RepID=A0ACA9TIX8_BIOOC|nr:unnamed protein product [Clonostachys rosea f. rosea IK726]